MPNNDLISRAAAIAQIKENYCDWCDHTDLCRSCETRDCIDTIEQEAPAVDAVPVVHGRWIEIETEDAYDFAGIKTWALKARCSECGFVMKFIEAHTGQYIYCPHCSAQMDGGDTDDHDS